MPDIFVAKEKEKKPKKPPAKPKQTEIKTVADELKAQRTTNPFASLVIRPEKITFDTQEREEKIIFLTRRHLITNLKWALVTIGMILLPSIAFRLLPEVLSSFRFRIISLLVWYLLTFSYAFEQFLKWFFNVSIVTDERVVDIDFPTILYRDVSSTKIDMIQDISVKMGGFIRSLFNYGDVYIQTAGEEREFIFEDIAQPEQVIKILNQLILEEEQEKIDGRVR